MVLNSVCLKSPDCGQSVFSCLERKEKEPFSS
jgi:hypothetical protein